MCGRATVSARAQIIEALEELAPVEHPFLSSSLVEALQSLGALEDSERDHIDIVRTQVRGILADQINSDMQATAYRVWLAQFDHPYSGTYCEVMSELLPEDKKQLLAMAGRGAGQTDPFVNILILEIASCDDPALADIIERWTTVPPTRCVMPQEAIASYVIAHMALAHLGCSLPEHGGTEHSDAAKALEACGRIYYWLNRFDLSLERRKSECGEALAVLSRHDLGASTGVLRDLDHSHFHFGDRLLRRPDAEKACTSIGEAFPAEVAEICRQCLRSPSLQRGYFEYFDPGEVLAYAVEALGTWGDSADLVLLRSFADNPRLGSNAIGAIKKLERGGGR